MANSVPLLGVVGIDGHDGTGKTTIARAVAQALNASYQRPFGGERGALLLGAHRAGDQAAVLRIGTAALLAAIHRAGTDRPVVLDRSWMTGGSLLSDENFYEHWTIWTPTILCWADLPTTLSRLGERDEPAESLASHRHYIERYRTLAQDRGCPVVDTSRATVPESTAEALHEARRLLRWCVLST